MNSMTSENNVTGACDICKRKFSAVNQAGLNKAIGFHKRMEHNIPGKWSVSNQAKRNAALRRYYERTGRKPTSPKALAAFNGAPGGRNRLTEDELRERKRIRQRNYRAAMKTKTQPAQEGYVGQVERMELNYCPVCGAHFFYGKTNNNK